LGLAVFGHPKKEIDFKIHSKILPAYLRQKSGI
jgi:hypothetical protein